MKSNIGKLQHSSVDFVSAIIMIFCDDDVFFLQASTFVQLLDGEDSDEKAVTAMGILNTLETMLNVMEGSKAVR